MTRLRPPALRAAVLTALAGLVACSAPALSQEPTPGEIVRRGKEYLAPLDRLEEIRTLDALAECSGPTGPFTTLVLSHRGGDMVFHQSYDDAPDFLAGIRDGRAWQASGDSTETLTRESAAFLRAHEFLTVLLMPTVRLSDPEAGEVEVFRGTVARPVEFTDVAGSPFVIHYGVDEGRPLGYTITNPTGEGPPLIQVELTGWREWEGLRLPARLTIYHGDQTWHYEFTRVRVDSLEDPDFDPDALAAGDR